MSEDYKRESEDYKRESEDYKRESEDHKRKSDGHKRESGGHKRESDDHKRESVGHKRESDGHKRESGGHKRESGGYKRESDGHKRESGDHKRDSEDRKREIRTQGKFSDMSKIKSQDRRRKSSPVRTRYSNESRGSNNSYTDEDTISSVKYKKNSDYSFDQFEPQRKATVIEKPGKHTLSVTENGKSLIFYEPQLFEIKEAEDYYIRLYSSINWYSKNIVINGEKVQQPRLIAWFGPYPYSYSGATLEPQDMPDCVIEIKERVEEYLSENGFNATFNSVLLNLYRNGRDSVAWHSDDELTMGISPTIASVSLGETRRFEMRPRKRYSEDENHRAEYLVHLVHGSLIVMDGCMQDDWQHRVPKEYHDRDPRINLTFRTVYPIEEATHREHIRELKKKQVDEYTSNRSSSNKINFNDDDFPPLKNEVNFQPSKSKDTSQPLKNENDLPALMNEDNFPALQNKDNLLPLRSEDGSSPLNRDVNPILTQPCLDDRNLSLNSSSNLSVRNDNLNISYGQWDSETSSSEKFKAENDIPDNDHTHDNYFETNEINKYAEKSVDDNDNSFELNLAESQGLGDSVSSSDATEEYVDSKKPSKVSFLNVAAKEFVPMNLFPYRPDYSKFPLGDLVHYEVNVMTDETLQDFAKNLKNRVLERLTNFSHCIRDELEFLCSLSDGTQSEKNQKLISARMINIVSEDIKRHQTFTHHERSYNRHRTYSYGKQNNVDRGRYRQHRY